MEEQQERPGSVIARIKEENKKSPEVATALSMLAEEIATLSKQADLLGNKISPILRISDEEKPVLGLGEIKFRTPVAQSIDAQAYEVAMITNRVRSIISRIEV